MRKLASLRERRLPAEIRVRAITEAYEQLPEAESTKWLIGAMQPINPEYTRETITQADRVKNHLEADLPGLGITPAFDYQGSVTNDTHIRAYSDVDLLMLHLGFVYVDAPLSPTSRYAGDVISELVDLRQKSVRVVRVAFPAVEVDDSGAKSVSVTGGSLTRKVDLVTSYWWNTNDYAKTREKQDRGIRVLDVEERTTIPNKPFLHNARIDYRDRGVRGSLRKAARLLKSLKYDADRDVNISSYDIVSICFNMPDELLRVPDGAEPLLAQNCSRYLDRLEQDSAHRAVISVPNGMRRVFCAEGATTEGLGQLNRELKQLLHEVENDLTRSFRKLAEARIRL